MRNLIFGGKERMSCLSITRCRVIYRGRSFGSGIPGSQSSGQDVKQGLMNKYKRKLCHVFFLVLTWCSVLKVFNVFTLRWGLTWWECDLVRGTGVGTPDMVSLHSRDGRVPDRCDLMQGTNMLPSGCNLMARTRLPKGSTWEDRVAPGLESRSRVRLLVSWSWLPVGRSRIVSMSHRLLLLSSHGFLLYSGNQKKEKKAWLQAKLWKSIRQAGPPLVSSNFKDGMRA